MTTTTIKHQEDIRVIKTPNQRMQETNIKQGMVFKVYRQQNHPFPDESFIIAIVKTSADRLQAISIEKWNRFSDETYSESATVAEVMQTSKYNYIYFEVMNEIEVIIK
jgi:hypothetical protein